MEWLSENNLAPAQESPAPVPYWTSLWYNGRKVVTEMVEKVVRSLRDLEDALAMATREGGCRIRVGDQVAALGPPDTMTDVEAERFLNHPEVAERLNKSVRSLDEGRGISHQEVVKRFGRGKV